MNQIKTYLKIFISDYTKTKILQTYDLKRLKNMNQKETFKESFSFSNLLLVDGGYLGLSSTLFFLWGIGIRTHDLPK